MDVKAGCSMLYAFKMGWMHRECHDQRKKDFVLAKDEHGNYAVLLNILPVVHVLKDWFKLLASNACVPWHSTSSLAELVCLHSDG